VSTLLITVVAKQGGTVAVRKESGMLLHNTEIAVHPDPNRVVDDARDRILDVLCHRYVREKQHVMRFRQHAERIADDKIRRALLRMAAKEEGHVDSIAAYIVGFGGKLPTVLDFHCSRDNSWEYLRSDLDDERRCIAEIADDKLTIGADFPPLATLLDRIEADAKKHREEIRALLSDENRPLWAA
jgi:hypothetical protein